VAKKTKNLAQGMVVQLLDDLVWTLQGNTIRKAILMLSKKRALAFTFYASLYSS